MDNRSINLIIETIDDFLANDQVSDAIDYLLSYKSTLGSTSNDDLIAKVIKHVMSNPGSKDLLAHTMAGAQLLYAAVRYGKASDVKTLLGANTNMTTPVMNGQSPLTYALEEMNDPKITGLLLDAIASAKNINEFFAISTNGESLLHTAVRHKNTLAIMSLIEAGVDVNIRDKNGMTPLMIAAMNNNVATAYLLIVRGADINAVDANGKNTFDFITNIDVKDQFIEMAEEKANRDKAAKGKAADEKLTARIARAETSLHHGPRIKSQATKDFEKIAAAFADSPQPKWEENRFGEITVLLLKDKDKEIYNLSKILEANPDFEHLDIHLTPEQLQRNSNFLSNLTPKYDYDPGSRDKSDKRNRLNEAEERSIYYYTLAGESKHAYSQVNKFLRENGVSQELGKGDHIDLRTVIVMLTHLPQGLIKLREAKGFTETLHRGESYPSKEIVKKVSQTRLGKSLVSQEAGIYSTSKDKSKSEEFETGEKQPLRVVLTHHSESYGVSLNALSEYQEGEVLFIPGTQFIYQHAKGDPSTLEAIPVRTISEIYPSGYGTELIQLREKLITQIQIYSMQPYCDPALLQTMEDCVRKIGTYGAGMKSTTLNACYELYQTLHALPKSSNTAENKLETNIKKLFSDIIQICGKEITAEISHTQNNIIQAGKYVYERFLIHPYKDEDICANDLSVDLDGVTIYRPNHGLATHMRTAMYVPAIHLAFKSHAADENFKHVMDHLGPIDIELTQLALLFRTSGRESEIGFRDNPARYTEYRLNSEKYFREYVSANILNIDPDYDHPKLGNKVNAIINDMKTMLDAITNIEFIDANLIVPPGKDRNERLTAYFDAINALQSDLGRFNNIDHHDFAEQAAAHLRVLKSYIKDDHMNSILKRIDAVYEQSKNRRLLDSYAALVKNIANPTYYEQLINNKQYHEAYIFHIATYASRIDLLRCFDSTELTSVIDKAHQVELNGLIDSDFVTSAAPALYDMAAKCITVTGDRLFTKFEDGHLVETDENYNAMHFIECSSNPESCVKLSFLNSPILSAVYEGKTNIDVPESHLHDKSNNKNKSAAALSTQDAINQICTAISNLDTDLSDHIIQQSPYLQSLTIDEMMDMQNDQGQTPAILATIEGRHQDLEILREEGVNLDIEDNEGYTAMHHAVVNGDAACLAELLLGGADPDIVFKPCNRSPFILAVLCSTSGIINMLLNSGADINSFDLNHPYDTPLLIALDNEDTETAKNLIKRGAYVNVSNDKEDTPLYLSVTTKNHDAIKLLLKSGADVLSKASGNKNPLLFAVKKDYSDIANLLIASVDRKKLLVFVNALSDTNLRDKVIKQIEKFDATSKSTAKAPASSSGLFAHKTPDKSTTTPQATKSPKLK